MRGLSSASVAALAWLAEPKTRSSASGQWPRRWKDTGRRRRPREVLRAPCRRRLRRSGPRSRRRRETVRQDEQQPIGRAGFGLEDLAGAADTGAEARVARRLELVEPGSPDGAETLPERFDRREMHRVSAL